MTIAESNQSDATVRELAKAIYCAFRPHVSRYGHYESAHLRQELSAHSAPAASRDLIDELRAVAVSVPKVAAIFAEASKRCCDLTQGCAYPMLKSAIEECLGGYLERFTNLCRRLDKRKAATNSWNILQQSLTLNQVR